MLISKWSSGADICVACDGNEGLGKLRSQSYHLAFLDNNMPGLNGIEIARLVQANPLPNSTYLVILSGIIHDRERAALLDAGISDMIEKPLTLEKFQQVLKNAKLR